MIKFEVELAFSVTSATAKPNFKLKYPAPRLATSIKEDLQVAWGEICPCFKFFISFFKKIDCLNLIDCIDFYIDQI